MTQVNHNQFGKGTVVSNDGTNVTVDFSGVQKIMVIKYARLTNEDGTPFGTQAVAAPAKAKKLNRANFMTQEEFAKTRIGQMSKDEWESYLEAKINSELPSSLQR